MRLGPRSRDKPRQAEAYVGNGSVGRGGTTVAVGYILDGVS